MSTTSFGSSLLQTSDMPQSAPGSIRETEDHAEAYVYVKNSTGSALAAGELVVSGQTASIPREAATSLAATGSPRAQVLGGAEFAVPSGHWFWAKKRGTFVGIRDVAATTGAVAVARDDGKVNDAPAAGAAEIGTDIGYIVLGGATPTLWLDL